MTADVTEVVGLQFPHQPVRKLTTVHTVAVPRVLLLGSVVWISILRRRERPDGAPNRYPLRYFAAVLVPFERPKAPACDADYGSLSGRYWVRTSDLFGVNEARYHCANRPSPLAGDAHLIP